ncbi:hypothetical protein DPEC_G00102400 [Dallia pectoralis]|uniref:Uncharacterized protein n=1 Tax=Dallia pectoralis TaxID=75939 RepID=A0ACC2GX18_DALPE|nr:hypothetical protein DPEC_G00102400 [Dallia pectoralis]
MHILSPALQALSVERFCTGSAWHSAPGKCLDKPNVSVCQEGLPEPLPQAIFIVRDNLHNHRVGYSIGRRSIQS